LGEKARTNAGSAGVGQDHATELFKRLELAITLNGGANLLRAGRDGEKRLGLDAVVHGVLGDGCSARHVLVGGVGARSDKANLELLGPVVRLDSVLELADGGGQIGSEGSVDVGLKFGKVDLDQLVVLGALVLAEFMGIFAGEVTNVGAFGRGEVVVHAVVEGEDGGGGADFGSHVTAMVSISTLLSVWCREAYQMVAMPVQLSVSVPGPWYSTMAPVPPLTVRMPATLRMMSSGRSAYSSGYCKPS